MSGGQDGGSHPSRSNFFYALLLLPRPRRRAMLTFYRFCRALDDAVDEVEDTDDQGLILTEWEKALHQIGNHQRPSTRAEPLAEIVEEYGIPMEPLLEILEGVKMDLSRTRYETYEELKTYCDRVAGAVGLVALRIFGIEHPARNSYAMNLGAGLQLINIARDVQSDAGRGRIYLPLEALQRFAVPECDILAGRYSEAFARLMDEHALKARAYLRLADRTLFKGQERLLFPAEAMRRTYLELLKKLEENRFNVFCGEEIRLGHVTRFRLALAEWIRARLP
jgi:phytoene synthase